MAWNRLSPQQPQIARTPVIPSKRDNSGEEKDKLAPSAEKSQGIERSASVGESGLADRSRSQSQVGGDSVKREAEEESKPDSAMVMPVPEKDLVKDVV